MARPGSIPITEFPVSAQSAHGGLQTPDELLLRAAERGVQDYMRVAFGFGLPAAGGFIGSFFALLSGEPFMPLVMGTAVCYAAALWFVRPHLPGRTVLWIRRFNQGDRARRLQEMVAFATTPTGNFITLADGDVMTESENPLIGQWYFAVMVGVGFLVWLYLENDPAWVAGPAVGVLWYAVYRGLAAWARRRALTERNMEKEFGRAIRAARWHMGAKSVFRCPRQGGLWMQAIRFVSNHVGAVIIFADEASPGLSFEIDLLLESGRLGPRNMVILHSGPSPDLLVHHPRLADAWSFQVPARMSSWWPFSRAGLTLSYLIRAAAMSEPGASTPIALPRGRKPPSLFRSRR
ncbi:MAG TPA: hypothetical protein VHG93_18140 [Longimicrobium sp.]|nr:hypothetical protein [Longimicrobium sp.]